MSHCFLGGFPLSFFFNGPSTIYILQIRLRKEAWSGIPAAYRAQAWQVRSPSPPPPSPPNPIVVVFASFFLTRPSSSSSSSFFSVQNIFCLSHSFNLFAHLSLSLSFFLSLFLSFSHSLILSLSLTHNTYTHIFHFM